MFSKRPIGTQAWDTGSACVGRSAMTLLRGSGLAPGRISPVGSRQEPLGPDQRPLAGSWGWLAVPSPPGVLALGPTGKSHGLV